MNAEDNRMIILRKVRPLINQIIARYGKKVLAVALIGSASRGEETWINGKMVSDVEIGLITKRSDPFFYSKLKLIVDKHVNTIPFDVEVGCIPLTCLKNHKNLELYEARETSKVLWGDKDIFRYVPIRSEKEIPMWEGIRLLFNRAFDLLEALCGKKNPTYSIVKAYLAIGEAYLIFDGRYKCSYRERLDQIQLRCNLHIIDSFVEKFEKCSRFKLNQCNRLGLTFREAKVDLLNAIRFFLSAYTGSNMTLDRKIEILSKRFYHPYHAIVFFMRKLRQKKVILRSLVREPCFIVWSEAIKLLRENSHDIERIKDILEDWHIAPQFVINNGGRICD